MKKDQTKEVVDVLPESVDTVSQDQVEQEFKPFNQIPEWKADSNITVKGNEFEALYNYFNIVMPSVTALQAIFQRAVEDKVITIKHEYTDGSGEVPKEVLEAYFAKLNELMSKQLQK